MSIAIDLVLVLIAGFCTWRGLQNGIVRGVFGVLALIVSVYAANIVATAYSGEFTGMLKPFVGGVVDSVLSDMQGGGDSDSAQSDESEQTQSEDTGMFELAFTALRAMGLPVSAAENVAESSSGDHSGSVGGLAESITDKLSSLLAYVAVFGVCFLLMSIVFAVIGNLINLVFSIPGLDKLDKLLGAVFGLAKGLIIVFVIATVIRYIGLIAPSIVEETVVLKYFANVNPIAILLGI